MAWEKGNVQLKHTPHKDPSLVKRAIICNFSWKDFGEHPLPSGPLRRTENLFGEMIKIFLEEVLGSLAWEAFAWEDVGLGPGKRVKQQ